MERLGLEHVQLRAVALSAPEAVAEVLIVDDDELLLGALVQLVSQLGYPTTGTASGQEALAYLQRATPLPGLILTDQLMPLMSGEELVMRLRHEPALATLPVVILTAARQRAGEAAGCGAGVTVLPKALRASELAGFIEAKCPRRVSLEPASAFAGIGEPSPPA